MRAEREAGRARNWVAARVHLQQQVETLRGENVDDGAVLGTDVRCVSGVLLCMLEGCVHHQRVVVPCEHHGTRHGFPFALEHEDVGRSVSDCGRQAAPRHAAHLKQVDRLAGHVEVYRRRHDVCQAIRPLARSEHRVYRPPPLRRRLGASRLPRCEVDACLMDNERAEQMRRVQGEGKVLTRAVERRRHVACGLTIGHRDHPPFDPEDHILSVNLLAGRRGNRVGWRRLFRQGLPNIGLGRLLHRRGCLLHRLPFSTLLLDAALLVLLGRGTPCLEAHELG